MHGLNNLKEGDHSVAAVIDVEEKSVRTTNITCMARWCDFKRKPLSVDQFINNYDRLVVEKDNKLFSDSDNPFTISIKYGDQVEAALNNETPGTNKQKRYRAIEYQQRLLNYIFNYYENNQERYPM